MVGSAEVTIADLGYDASGNDVEFGNSEYVLLQNNGSGTADVGGWSLWDEADHIITIPFDYQIAPGGMLHIHTGPGDNTETTYFAGLGQAIWNNSGGDIATLRNAEGEEVDTYTYSSKEN